MEHVEGKDHHMHEQPPSYSTTLSSSSSPSKYINLFSSANDTREVQLTTSSAQMNYDEFCKTVLKNFIIIFMFFLLQIWMIKNLLSIWIEHADQVMK